MSPRRRRHSDEAVEEVADGGVFDVGVELRGLHAERRIDVEVGVVSPHEHAVCDRQHKVHRERRLCKREPERGRRASGTPSSPAEGGGGGTGEACL